MSKHEVKVVKIETVLPHNNSDNLELVQIWGYQVVVKRNQFPLGSLAAYIESDYKVNITRNEFRFLDDGKGKEWQRITMRKFRGEPSYGLLIPAPQGSVEGDNVMELLGVERYEPQAPKGAGMHSGIQAKGPDLNVPTYDLENFRKFHRMFHEGEQVIFTEKVHGCLHAGTLITTDEGEILIKKIVEDHMEVKVKSFNHTTGEVEYQPIIDWMATESSEATEWFEVILENGTNLKLTGNHRVWLPELGCYREVSELTENDSFLVDN
jgi:RNA ligase (TIGR02306 family)